MNLARLPWELRYQTLRSAGSTLRRVRTQLLHRHCTVTFEDPVYIGPGFDLHIPGAGTLQVGKYVQFRRGFTCEITGNGVVTIGDKTIFTYETIIQCSTRVDIGSGCIFSRSLIADGSHRFRDGDLPIVDQGYDHRHVRIGDGAAIMSGAVVTASVGDRSFIAANSVVTRPIEPYVLAGGSPARVIERFSRSETAPSRAETQ